MTTIHDTVLKRALTMLDAIKAQYAVVWDGHTFGALEIKPPKPLRIRPVRFHNDTKHGYTTKIRAAAPGDVLQFKCDSDAEADSLRGAVSSMGIAVFGKGGVVTEFHRGKDHTVTALIVGPAK